jgi:hypothetical protein
MARSCNTQGKRKCTFCPENVKERDQFTILDVDRKILLKLILNKCYTKVVIAFTVRYGPLAVLVNSIMNLKIS